MKNNNSFLVSRLSSLKYLKLAFYMMLTSVWIGIPNAVFAEVTGTHVDPNNRNKVIICHFPPGNPGNVQTISISKNALQTHIDHDYDYDGECNNPSQGAGTLR